MELARGYLNPNFSGWKTIPIQTKDLYNEESESEDPVDEKEDELEKKEPEKKRKHNQTDTTGGAQNSSGATHIP